MELKSLTNDELVALVKQRRIKPADLTDAGICPTCFDRENNNVLYGDNTNMVIYEDDDFEAFLVGNPRAEGHTAISTKIHYKDIMEADDETCKKIIVLAKTIMNYIKEIYGAESVYLCTMCDGPMNHFHVQLIPRYSYEERGSDNFVKPRTVYVEDKEKIFKLREKLNYNPQQN